MKSFESFTNKQLATGLALAVGALGLTACSTDKETTSDSRGIASYPEGTYVYPNKDDSSRVEGNCDGTALTVKRVRNANTDSAVTWLDDPACADRKLTPEDDLTSAVYAVSD